jgi:transposase, IS5 family
MRKRFEQQFSLGRLLIEDTQIPTKKRSGALPGLYAALKEIYMNREYNEKIFSILESKILSKNNKTGRVGLDLWQIFVLAQVRLCQNISYDDLHYISNYDTLMRQIMGIETESGFDRQEIGYQRIIDNVGLLDDETVRELNQVIVELGHGVLKKKEAVALQLKTDSFVVESNVHFPTDYNLLWDSARKSIDMIIKLQEKHKLPGWRKLNNWRNDLKNKMRALGRASASGGKGKQDRVRLATKKYLAKAKGLYNKLEGSRSSYPQTDAADLVIVMELDGFMQLLNKHIDLLERRVINGEEILHNEKMFSIFEQYTEWVTKGKMHPNVELGKKTTITTDQFNLIVDYQIMDNQSDSEIVPELANRIFSAFSVKSWSFDKGFWHKDNKILLSESVENLVLPKKGKCSISEAEEEHRPIFKKLRHKHSAVESNINELEHRGLNRCPDKGYPNFKKYIGLAVCAYNLRRIGEQLIQEMRQQKLISLKQAA